MAGCSGQDGRKRRGGRGGKKRKTGGKERQTERETDRERERERGKAVLGRQLVLREKWAQFFVTL